MDREDKRGRARAASEGNPGKRQKVGKGGEGSWGFAPVPLPFTAVSAERLPCYRWTVSCRLSRYRDNRWLAGSLNEAEPKV